jgi:hypothetical protein
MCIPVCYEEVADVARLLLFAEELNGLLEINKAGGGVGDKGHNNSKNGHLFLPRAAATDTNTGFKQQQQNSSSSPKSEMGSCAQWGGGSDDDDEMTTVSVRSGEVMG